MRLGCSCRYVCANEGHRKPDKRDHLTKCPRAETRTNCQVRMELIMDKKKGNYKVTDLFLNTIIPFSCHKPHTYGVPKENFRVTRF